MKKLAAVIAVINMMQLIAKEEDVARAFVRWERHPSLISALHVATSGLFLAEDVAAIG